MPLADPKKRREYHARYMKEVWYPRNKKKHLSYIKRNKERVSDYIERLKRKGRCADCGFSGKAYPYVLDFDHQDGGVSKKFNVGSWRRSVLSIESVQREIAKCELVCANCHRIRTFSDKRKRN